MTPLLDTRILLWWLADDRRLSADVRGLITTAPIVVVSAASAWEIALKRALGKLRAPADLAAVVARCGFSPLPITLQHAEAAGALPRHHHDPFDRMLIAQAEVEGLVIVTLDDRFRDYGVATVGI